jgi:hypothetical protein
MFVILLHEGQLLLPNIPFLLVLLRKLIGSGDELFFKFLYFTYQLLLL